MYGTDLIVIGNDGPLIKTTNYWGSPYALSGYAYLTWNAGTARLLLPDSIKYTLRDMATAKFVIISCGPSINDGGRAGLEVMFEDYSDTPFVLNMCIEQASHVPLEHNLEKFTLAVWTRGGLKQRHSAKFRRVGQLPCLAPWEKSTK